MVGQESIRGGKLESLHRLKVTRECPQPFHNIVECGTEEVSHVQDGALLVVGVVVVGVFLLPPGGPPKKNNTTDNGCHFSPFKVCLI